MYCARFDLERQTWHVAAAQVSGGADVLPAAVRESVHGGQLTRFALRHSFIDQQSRTVLMVAGANDSQLRDSLAGLRDHPHLRWCGQRDDYDALHADLGPTQHWLSARGLHAGALPVASAASLANTWSALRALSARGGVSYQINAAHRPLTPDGVRRLRKLGLRLRAMADDDQLPLRIAEGQIALIERRLQHPWLVDELVAGAAPGLADLLRHRVAEQCQAQGLPLGDGDALVDGDWGALWCSGLDSSCFEDDDETTEASRCWREDQLLELLARARGAPPATAPGARWDLFISHASADSATATALCTALESLGLRCWMAPRDIAAGSHYAESIITALEQCRGCVVLLSPPALASPHVLREVERTVSLRRLLLPVRLTDTPAQGAMSYLLIGSQWLDHWSVTPAALARQLAAALRLAQPA